MGTIRSAYWRIILIMVAVMVCGLLRVAWDLPPLQKVDFAKAERIAQCLVPQGEIPVGTNITVRQLMVPQGQPAKDSLNFITTGPVTVEIADPALRQAAANPNNTEKVRLPDKTQLSVAKGKGEFEFQLKNLRVELERAGARLLVTGQMLHFGPADTASYTITLNGDTDLETKDTAGKPKTPTLPPGTKGSLPIGDGVYLSALQPLRTMPWLLDAPPNLLPVRATGQKGLSELTVDARQSGFQFNAAGIAIRACVYDGNNTWWTAGVAEVKSQEAGAANIRLSLPAEVLPRTKFYTPIELAVASSDGQYVAYGGFAAIGRAAAWLIASIFTLALFWWLFNLRHGQRVRDQGVSQNDWQSWRIGLFIGADNEPSLSLFQIFFWTVITIWGLAYVFTVTGTLLSLTAEMMTLLGIAGTGSVLSRLIASRQATVTSPPAYPPPPGSSTEFWQMLSTKDRSGKDSFDLMKLQLFVFTLVIGVYVVWRITDTGTFPVLDTNTLLLLGVSQGIYVGGKFSSA